MKKIVILLSILMLLTACDSKKTAPFGMTWGSNINKFPKSKLLTFNLIPLSDSEDMIYVTTVPKDSLGDGGYRFFYKNKKLSRIEFSTYDEKEDFFGEKGRSNYNRLKAVLVKQYGNPNEITEHVYSDDFRFILCVTYENCGRWESTFANKNTIAKVSIQMGLTEEGYKNTSQSSRVMVEFQPK